MISYGRLGTLESSLKLLLEQVVVLPITSEIAALGAQFHTTIQAIRRIALSVAPPVQKASLWLHTMKEYVAPL